MAQVGALEFDTPFVNIALGDDHRGTCHLRRTKGDMAGEGNGRYVVFDSPTGLLLKIYLRSVGRSPDTTPDEPIFGMTGNGIRLMIERHRTEAGLPEISAHAFRRAFADYWDEHNGPELRIVLKKQLGHSVASRDVTELHYINQNPRRAAREIMQHHISPMREIRIDWRLLPVHIQEVVSGA
ncbi:MAG: hypothetical protein KatS3mg051_1032 [Anaerolineae bacterium]|nr:MAG: hypothetical protein KatS3mg051_1032 [Anaerolineae bacterium]